LIALKKNQLLFFTVFAMIFLTSFKIIDNNWLAEKQKGYSLYYTVADKTNTAEYKKIISNGIKAIKTFFGSGYKQTFDIYVHPNRHSLDSTWQKDWNMPGFKSECWMVASGIANKLDMISPKIWDVAACEHIYAQTKNTQQLITHELVHVYHAQLNSSADFSNTEGIDWFVEGLATFASGQCDAARIAQVKKAIADNKIPKALDNFWTGNIKYGLSGSLVMFINHQYGAKKLKQLLPFNKKQQILEALKISEEILLHEWKAYVVQLPA
jgi:hypothetical protein